MRISIFAGLILVAQGVGKLDGVDAIMILGVAMFAIVCDMVDMIRGRK